MTTNLVTTLRYAWAGQARAISLALIFSVCLPAMAGPGAHGPGGEHLDAPGAQGSRGSATPRLEAKSELFELVSVLGGGELSTLINRFETNEPVLNASVEVAMGTFKAAAKFHVDHGDYSVDDAAFLKALSVPGEYSLIFTIVAGGDSDLLEGSLTVKAVADEHAGDHGHLIEYSAIAAGLLAAMATAYGFSRRLRRRSAYAAGGRLS